MGSSVICRHFERCGGCSLQHLGAKSYLVHKQNQVERAFADAGIDTAIEPVIACPAHSRRRVTFTAKREKGDILLGFQQSRSHEVIDIAECPIALPEIVGTLPVLRDLAATLLQGISSAQLTVTACENGLDLSLRIIEPPSETVMADLVRLLTRSPFIRCGMDDEIVFEREKPLVEFGDLSVVLPPNGFLQAVKSAEEALADLVCTHLKKCKRVTDLFSGCGTFSLQLATRSRVHAVESYKPALDSLSSVSAEGLKPITTEVRDLFDLPLTVAELSRFDGICLDPPRAGAMTQVKEIAKSEVARVVYVSCNPETLARDTKELSAGGYALERVVPVDQFVFSDHVEAAALFSKQSSKAKRSIFR
ncbi:MAG: class I SAM-dependent RNA methyltransferase [Rhizobiaceae bacterium]